MKNNKGFSLVELIVVIAIMAVLVGVLAPTLLRYVEKSRAQKDDSAMDEVTNAIQLAIADEKIYDAVIGNAASGTTSVVYTFAPTNGVITFSADNVTPDTDDDDLLGELKGTCGESITLGSKTHKGQSYKVTVDFSGTNDNVKVYGEWINSNQSQ